MVDVKVKLHLGCGKRHIPGWFHIDAINFPHIDLVSAVDVIPQAANESASIIYAAHVLEHFPMRRVPEVLREWKRILKPGGKLRLAVPDMKAAAKLYLETGDLNLVRGLIWGAGTYLYNIHYSGFDYQTLWTILCEIGFYDVAVYDWRKTEHAHIDDYSQAYYPHMDRNGTLLSLNMEATK